MSGPKTMNGKIVLQAYLLDTSYKALLIEPTSTAHVRARPLGRGGGATARRGAIVLTPAPAPPRTSAR